MESGRLAHFVHYRWHDPFLSRMPIESARMRVLVIDELAEDLEERAETLRDGLERAGHEVVASLSSPLELLRAVERLRPEVIVIDTESPTRDVLEHLVIVSQSSPRPIVMFASDSGGEAIREAVRAGFSEL